MNYHVIFGTATVLVLIICILALLAKAFKKNHSALTRRIWKVIHVTGVIIYIGGLLGQIFLHISAEIDPAHFHFYHTLMLGIDHYMIIPGAFLSVISGTWLAVRNGWGLTKHRWIIMKWLGNCLGILLGIILIGQTLKRRFILVIGEVYPTAEPGFQAVNTFLYFGQAVCLALLMFLVVISYIRPKNKTLRMEREVLS